VSYRHFVEQVQTNSGINDPARVERAIAATLEVLGERLRTPDARAVADKLPPELACHLTATVHARQQGEGAAPTDVALSRICSQKGVAAEELRAVCRVLAETLDEQGRAQLRMQPLTALFAS